MSVFVGSGVAIVTPFNKKNKVDYKAFERLLEFQIENKTDAIIVCGTTGEASTMSDDEKFETVKFAKEVIKGRVPLIVGTGTNNTKHTIDLTKEMEKIGADAFLMVTPYYNKTTQGGLVEHFKTIAKETKKPIILYNVPGRTAMNITAKTTAELFKIPNIVATKEASSDIVQIAEIASMCDIDIYSGNDDQIVPVMALGGKGVISVVANVIPKETHDIVELFLEGKIEESRELQLKIFNLIKLMFVETNPIPVKEALNMMGYKAGELRLPLVPMSEDNKKLLKKELEKFVKLA